MRALVVGAGPAGLYTAILLKKANPNANVLVMERKRNEDTSGFGMVLSESALRLLAARDEASSAELNHCLRRWSGIEIAVGGEVIRVGGHPFSSVPRRDLLRILQARCRTLDVEIRFERQFDKHSPISDMDFVVGADGASSAVRRWHPDAFNTSLEPGANRFLWLGTTLPLEHFTFLFQRSPAGLWRVHAYPYGGGQSAWIVECREDTWKTAGLEGATGEDTVAFCQELFAEQLHGHSLLASGSAWRTFSTVRNARWHAGNVVLIGDAAHATHFSVGRGTTLALEDAAALVDALGSNDSVRDAFDAFEQARRPEVERLQAAGDRSRRWFEDAERFEQRAPIQFAYSLLTRTRYVNHARLEREDAGFVRDVNTWFASDSYVCSADRRPSLTGLSLGPLNVRTRVFKSLGATLEASNGDPGGLRVQEVEPLTAPFDRDDWRPNLSSWSDRFGAEAARRDHDSRHTALLLRLGSGSQEWVSWLSHVAKMREVMRNPWPLGISIRADAFDFDRSGQVFDLDCLTQLTASGPMVVRIRCESANGASPVHAVDAMLRSAATLRRMGLITMIDGVGLSQSDMDTVLAAGYADFCVVAGESPAAEDVPTEAEQVSVAAGAR